MKVSSDLCDTCQQNNYLIMKAVNCTEEEKSARLKQQENHLALAKECRAYYKQQCEDSSITLSVMNRNNQEMNWLGQYMFHSITPRMS